MAQLVAFFLLLLHICSCVPLLPWGEILGSNAVFFSKKCSLLTLLQGPFDGKLVWHRIYYHTTTTEPLHPNPKKHIHKKPPAQKPPAHAIMSNDPSPHPFVYSGNLEYGEDFSALKELTKKDIFPLPACCLTPNGAPPKSGVTKTQQDKERKSVMSAKALVASENKLAGDAKKLASEGLKEKKKQLLTSRKAERNAIKAAAPQMKASASVLSTPRSALPELSGIRPHFPKKSKLTADQSTPSGYTASAHSTLSPQRKGDSPKKRAQLNQAPTFTPPHEYQATPTSSTSESWSSSDDESEEDFSTEESEEEDSIDWMVSNRA
jgi:hypothetical protein